MSEGARHYFRDTEPYRTVSILSSLSRSKLPAFTLNACRYLGVSKSDENGGIPKLFPFFFAGRRDDPQ